MKQWIIPQKKHTLEWKEWMKRQARENPKMRKGLERGRTPEARKNQGLSMRRHYKEHSELREFHRQWMLAHPEVHKAYVKAYKGKPRPKSVIEQGAETRRRRYREDPEYRKMMLAKAEEARKHFDATSRKKISETLKRLWRNPEYRETMLAAMRRGRVIKPNKLEKKLMALIEENNLPYRYVGDGSVTIDGFCPDFINFNGEKKIIELFGDYWHTKPDVPYHRTEEGRKAVFAKYGFETLVIWQHEFKEPEKVLQRIVNFT